MKIQSIFYSSWWPRIKSNKKFIEIIITKFLFFSDKTDILQKEYFLKFLICL